MDILTNVTMSVFFLPAICYSLWLLSTNAGNEKSGRASPYIDSRKPSMHLSAEKNAPRDFDFIIGDWLVKHRRLNSRFTNCKEWTEFDGLSSTVKTLGGFGNLEDNVLYFPEGSFRALALRSFCIKSDTWSIWWLDARNPTTLDVPVVGKFSNHIGVFFADDLLDGQAIKVRFTWTATPGENPRWEQAFSKDQGRAWETNWTMDFVRAAQAMAPIQP